MDEKLLGVALLLVVASYASKLKIFPSVVDDSRPPMHH